jgi:hypothetical protein
MAQRNSTHNDLQNIALDRATQNPLKPGVNSCALES